ncbi:MAG: hypothetical protein K6B44_04760 [Lachnospiraceae bacterium]|nr:hypothetical protein [Lachnospiraceae bacterium]
MSNEEVIELQELRKEKDLQARKIESLQFEVEDNDMALRALLSWKRFRWVGFALALAAFAVDFIFTLLHFKALVASTPGMYENYSDNITSSISTVSLLFSLLLLLALAVVCILLGTRLFMELGDSDAARLMAQVRMQKNFYTEREKILDRGKIAKRSLYEEEVKMKFLLPRLEELEAKETDRIR